MNHGHALPRGFSMSHLESTFLMVGLVGATSPPIRLLDGAIADPDSSTTMKNDVQHLRLQYPKPLLLICIAHKIANASPRIHWRRKTQNISPKLVPVATV